MSGPRITDAAVEAGARKLFAAHTDVAGDWDEPDYAGLRAWALEDAEDVLTAAYPHIRRAVIEELIAQFEDEAKALPDSMHPHYARRYHAIDLLRNELAKGNDQ